MHLILQGRRSWSFYVWTICFWETNGQKQRHSSIAFARISVYRLDNRCGKCKKAKTYGLVLLFHLQGRVAHFDRNPALPKDQPLRGSWLDCHSFLSNLAQKSIVAYPEFTQAIDYEFEIDHEIPTQVWDKTQSLCLLLRSTWLARKPFLYLSNLVQRAWFLIPNSPISHSVVRIFIVPKIRLLSSDDAWLG